MISLTLGRKKGGRDERGEASSSLRREGERAEWPATPLLAGCGRQILPLSAGEGKKVCSDRRHIEGPQRKSGRGKNLSKKSGVSADVSWSGKMKAPPPPWHGDLNICGVSGDSFL